MHIGGPAPGLLLTFAIFVHNARTTGVINGRCPYGPYRLDGKIDRDTTDLTILFEPGEEPPISLDPSAVADYDVAKAGPITGVVLGDKAKK